MRMTESAGSAGVEKPISAEYIIFANIARTRAMCEDEAVTASTAGGGIEFAAARTSTAKDTK